MSADLSAIDSLVCVSGDGLMVEVVNGLLLVCPSYFHICWISHVCIILMTAWLHSCKHATQILKACIYL